MNACPLFVLCFLFLLSALSAAPPPELVVVQQQYEKVVLGPHAASKADLDTKFIAALTNAATAAKKAGQLDDVLAIADDQKRLQEKLPIPDDDAQTPEGLKKLRSIYRDQLAKLDAQRSANHSAFLPTYTGRLKDLEIYLTKADRIEDARQVKIYRESLAANTAPVATVGDTAPPPSAPDMPAGPTASGKGDDRAAAELILSCGGSVAITNLPGVITTVDLLPKNKFTLAKIYFSDATNLKRKLEAADADKLMHLDQLHTFIVSYTITDDETLRFLATCPALTTVHVANCRWLTGSWLQYAAPLKNITSLMAVESTQSDLSALGNFQSLGITDVQFRTTGADDQTLIHLSRFKKLKEVRLRNTKITDAGMVHLASLKGLETVEVIETPVSVAGMKSLAGVPLTELGFGMSADDLAAAVPELGVLFPKVVIVGHPPGTTTASHLNALGKAWPKLKRLNFPSGQKFEPDAFISAGPLFPAVDDLYLWKSEITDEHIRWIAQLKKLAHLDIVDTQVTDACLADLERIKSLKTLLVSRTKITEAGLAAFKKARPNVTATR